MANKIGVIVGSTRPTRVGLKIALWVLEKMKPLSTELEFELIDLAEVNLPFLDEPKTPSSGEYTKPYTLAWSKKITAYDGFVIVTPEYNRGYPAPLKNALDYLAAEWTHKPVGFVGYGNSNGARSVEQLRLVSIELGMVPIWPSIGVRIPWEAVDEKGNVKDDYVWGNFDKFVGELELLTKTLKPLHD